MYGETYDKDSEGWRSTCAVFGTASQKISICLRMRICLSEGRCDDGNLEISVSCMQGDRLG